MFPDVKVKNYEYIDSIRISSPTCEQLGIPKDDQRYPIGPVRNTSLHIDGIRYEAVSNAKADPFSPYSMIPLPSPFGSVFDSTCIRRRNERERDRVRCVNDGYIRLKEHLPLENKDKRISKVETLRGAIQYIKQLQKILDDNKADTYLNGSEQPNSSAESGRIKHSDSGYKSTEAMSNGDSIDVGGTSGFLSDGSDSEMQGIPAETDTGQNVKINSLQVPLTMRPN